MISRLVDKEHTMHYARFLVILSFNGINPVDGLLASSSYTMSPTHPPAHLL